MAKRTVWYEQKDPDECWPWPTPIKAPYPQLMRKIDGQWRHVVGHRLALELKLGRPLKPGEQARHTCDNTRCGNPAHLEPGTPRDNSQDMVRRGRSLVGERNPARKLADTDRVMIRASQEPSSILAAYPGKPGEHNPNAKLTAVQVVAIRADRRSTAVIAEAYGVQPRQIRRIRKGERW